MIHPHHGGAARGPRILCLCLNPAIDRVVRVPEIRGGAHVVGQTLLRQPAGKAVNVCRSLARLGTDSLLIGFIGRREQAWFTRTLQAMRPGRVACRWLALPQHTRESVTLLDTSTGQEMHIREPGFAIDFQSWRELGNQVLDALQPGDQVVLAGSPPPGLPPEFLLELLAAVGNQGGQLLVDLSGPSLAAVLRHPPDGLLLVKPNLDEFAQAIGCPGLTLEALPRAMLAAAAGIPWLLVSLGKQGAMVRHQGRLWHGCLPLEQSRVVNTVGCGDAMLAGCLAALAPPEGGVLRLLAGALATASANAMAAGAGNFEADQVPRLAAICRIEPVPVG